MKDRHVSEFTPAYCLSRLADGGGMITDWEQPNTSYRAGKDMHKPRQVLLQR